MKRQTSRQLIWQLILQLVWQPSKQKHWRTLLAMLVIGVAPAAFAANAGQQAPNFTVTDTQGKPVQLSDFKGRYVVLEWTNPQCPFVRNHYNTKNMQALQESWGPRGVVWLSIDSSNKSSWSFMAPSKLDAFAAYDSGDTLVLIDPLVVDGVIYVLARNNSIVALDAATGKIVWYDVPPHDEGKAPPRGASASRWSPSPTTATTGAVFPSGSRAMPRSPRASTWRASTRARSSSRPSLRATTIACWW